MKKVIKDEYPKVIETFHPPASYELDRWVDRGPSSFNGIVCVEKYRITIERIEEPKEVLEARLIELWENCDNHHEWRPLQNTAKRLGIELPDTCGIRRPKRR